MDNSHKRASTKQKLLESAIHLFAIKGFTETTIRELASAVGVKEASIYNHYSSKNAILECILEEYASQITSSYYVHEKLLELGENATAEGILSCMALSFPEDKANYYLEELCVILQEQHRNPIVRKFISERVILGTEHDFKTIIDKLKELCVLRPDTDPDFWIKMHSSLVYTFASRLLLGIGDNNPDFVGMNMVDMMHNLYDIMLKMCGTENYLSRGKACPSTSVTTSLH